MWTGSFWKGSFERAVKTLAQAALALVTGEGLGLLDVDWVNLASVAGLAAIASVLTSIVSLGVGPVGSASVVDDRP